MTLKGWHSSVCPSAPRFGGFCTMSLTFTSSTTTRKFRMGVSQLLLGSAGYGHSLSCQNIPSEEAESKVLLLLSNGGAPVKLSSSPSVPCLVSLSSVSCSPLVSFSSMATVLLWMEAIWFEDLRNESFHRIATDGRSRWLAPLMVSHINLAKILEIPLWLDVAQSQNGRAIVRQDEILP